MFKRQTIRLATVLLLLAPYAMVVAQELSTADLVKGHYGKYATQLKLQDLPDDYAAVNIATSQNGLESYSSIYSLMGLSRAGNPGGSLQFRLYQCVWSNGDTVTSMHREFLVTYRLEVDLVQLASLASSFSTDNGVKSDLPSEPKLKINLVALDSIKSVSPAPEFTKKDLLGAYGQSSKSGFGMTVDPNRFQSAQASCVSNVKQLALGLLMYSNDYDDYIPYAEDTDTVKLLIEPYVRNNNLWNSYNPKGSRILFNVGVGGLNGTNIERPAETAILFESQPWEDGRRAVAFCDGHAKLVDDREWKRINAMMNLSKIKREGKPVRVKRT